MTVCVVSLPISQPLTATSASLWQALGGENLLRARHRGVVSLCAQHPALPGQQGSRHHEGGAGRPLFGAAATCLCCTASSSLWHELQCLLRILAQLGRVLQ